MIELAGLLPEEIAKEFQIEQKFRAKQIFFGVSKGWDDFQKFNIPPQLRQKLISDAVIYSPKVNQCFRDEDGNGKFSITLNDGNCVEAVVLTDKTGRRTLCVSSQVGCAMNCAFCKTGTLGLARNLTAAEIVAQFLLTEKAEGKIDNVVFMGMGEPLANLDNVLKAVAVLTHKDGRNFSVRRFTVSTAGLVDKINELANTGLGIKLAVSLTAAEENLRKQLMPVAGRFSLPQLRDAIDNYSRASSRRVTLEIALLSGVNTGKDCARALVEFCRGLNVHINLIRWNRVEELPFDTPSTAEVESFRHILEEGGLNVTLRMSRGKKILGACGQLGKTNSVSK